MPRAAFRSWSAGPGSISARCSMASRRCRRSTRTVREAVRALPVEDAYAALAREDPARAAMLAPADAARIARALEVVRSTGRSLAAWQEQRAGGIGGEVALHPLVLLPDRASALRTLRPALCRDAGRRRGWRSRGPARPPARSRPAGHARHRRARNRRAGCAARPIAARRLRRGAQATRNYAKRQYTWFRRQPPREWPDNRVIQCRYRC